MNPPVEDDLPKETCADPAAAPGDEVDIWWGSWAVRSILPGLLLCAALTAGLVVASFFISRRLDLSPGTARAGFYIVAGALWLFMGLRWLYRAFGFNYRLTTRRLFSYRGFFLPAEPPILLTEVAKVLVEQTFLEGLLGIGRVRIETESRSPPTVLLGVPLPQIIADEISRCVRQARGAQ